MKQAAEAAGRLIVFEGIDGSGLSTQAALLHDHLRDVLHQAVYLTKEPTVGPAGALIRLRLLGRLEIDEAALALLFAADRIDHLVTGVLPRLLAGVHVISDRYYLSSLAYQSLDLDLDWLRAINARCRRPDLTVFLDVPVEVATARLKVRGRPLERYEAVETLRQVRANYLDLIPKLRQEGEQIVTIPAVAAGQERSIAVIAAEVRDIVGRLIGEPRQ